MNIAIDEHFDQFFREQVSSGRFQSAEEILLEGLRLVEYRESKAQALRKHLEAALDEGGGYSDEELDEILLRGALPD
jgi:antitoxin ParD1/3/4